MRIASLALTTLLALAVAAPSAYAQQRGGDAQKEAEEAAKRKQRDEEWNQPSAPLPALRNAGPCPYVKVLYDAGRFVDFKDGRESSGQVIYSGEIQGLSAGCQYQNDEPIRVRLQLLFSFGKGPQATSDAQSFRYWVAVTDRNRDVIAKEYFDLPVRFGGAERVSVRDELEGITIPRAGLTTSGSNFEVLVGFDVTPQMAAFNRAGKRFRVNVGSPAAASTDAQ
jgi:hypothetical protein